MNNHDYDIMFYAAFSYALGRRSYIVSSISTLCIQNLDKIFKSTKELMVRRIEKAILKDDIGMDCNRQDWIQLREAIENEKKRSRTNS